MVNNTVRISCDFDASRGAVYKVHEFESGESCIPRALIIKFSLFLRTKDFGAPILQRKTIIHFRENLFITFATYRSALAMYLS